MNVIFLDIDGVMNSNDYYNRKHNTFKQKFLDRWNKYIISSIRWIRTGSRYYSSDNWISNPKHDLFDYKFKRLVDQTDPNKWDILSRFCNETSTKICISSCWKHHFDYEDDNQNLEGWDKAFNLLGFKPDTFVGVTGSRCTLRGTEIKNWIIENNIRIGDSNYPHIQPVEKYAIIDDDGDMLPEQMDSFFHVDGYYGLSPNTVYRIGRHFNK